MPEQHDSKQHPGIFELELLRTGEAEASVREHVENCSECRELSEALARPPILSYTSIVLHNWRRLETDDTSAVPMLENLALQHCFWGGIDEQWFYLISVAIEAAGAPAVPALIKARSAVSAGHIDQLIEALREIHHRPP